MKNLLHRYRIVALALLVGMIPICPLLAQNVGIGTATPLDKLHIAGNVRVDPLAGIGNRIVGANSSGTLIVLPTGLTGQVLTQSVVGPSWQNNAGWLLLGNALTDPLLNFVGTTDVQALVFRTNNVERARITATGNVVVNSITPFATDIFSAYASGTGYAINGYSSGSGASGYFLNSATGQTVIGYHSGTLGSAAQFTISGAVSNPSPVVDVYSQTGTLPAVMVRTDIDVAGADGIELDINGATSKRGIDCYMDLANSGIGLAIFHDGTGRCINIQQQSASNVAPALFASVAGSARVLAAQTSLVTHATQIGFFSQASTGLIPATYQNAASVWGQSGGIRSGVFLAAGGSGSTVCLQGTYSGAAGNFDGIGVFGNFGPNPLFGYGVVGQGNKYGVYSNGNTGATGTKAFQIDHPLDPENMFLKHYSLESDEVLNMYRGTVTLDANGEATVSMPSYFHAINIDFSYNLTPIGASADLYIAREIDANGSFRIAGGHAGQKVCWNVYAERNDPYVQANPASKEVEVAKRPHEVGFYLLPEIYGQPQEKGLFYRYGVDPSKTTTTESSSPSQSTPNTSANPKEDAKADSK